MDYVLADLIEFSTPVPCNGKVFKDIEEGLRSIIHGQIASYEMLELVPYTRTIPSGFIKACTDSLIVSHVHVTHGYS